MVLQNLASFDFSGVAEQLDRYMKLSLARAYIHACQNVDKYSLLMPGGPVYRDDLGILEEAKA